MWLVNLILNLAGLLLWLRWREKNVRAMASKSQILLATTIKRTRPEQPRVIFLGGLLLLLSIRALFYWQLGAALAWVPTVKFGILPLSFRSDFFGRIVAFSFCSFAETLAIFLLALLLFSIVNEESSEANTTRRFVTAQLGWIDNLPTIAKLLLPWLVAVILWCALSAALVGADLLPARRSAWQVVAQASILGVGVYLIWEYVIAAVLILYVLNSYIYFGTWPFWDFIDKTGRRLLSPLSAVPLRIGKIDFAPAIAIALVVVIGESASYWLTKLYRVIAA